MSSDFVIRVRDNYHQDVAEVDDFREFTFVSRFNDVGAWELKIDRRSRLAKELTTPGYGIRVLNHKLPTPQVFSGPIRFREHSVDNQDRIITISGPSDEIWLQRRLASPAPTEQIPPYTTQAYDTIDDVASRVLNHYVDVNIGPAAVEPRRHPYWQNSLNVSVGNSVKGRARWNRLLPMLQGLAINGEVGFRVTQVNGKLQFQVYQPQDRTATVKFSEGLGNLAGFKYSTEAPEANHIYVGGQGEGTARTIVEASNNTEQATWGGRFEGEFVDRRDTGDQGELTQAGVEALTEGQEKASLTISPIDTDVQRFGQHYFLGDLVTCQIEGGPATPGYESGEIRDVIREVKISLTPDGQARVEPSIGNAPRTEVFRLMRTFRRLTNRVSNLERR